MTYYHVRITPKSGRSFSDDEVKLDLTSEELEERFLAPYRKGIFPINYQWETYLQ